MGYAGLHRIAEVFSDIGVGLFLDLHRQALFHQFGARRLRDAFHVEVGDLVRRLWIKAGKAGLHPFAALLSPEGLHRAEAWLAAVGDEQDQAVIGGVADGGLR